MPERPVAAITGGSSGIGASFARKLAARGYDVLLIARREERLRSLARELSDAHPVNVDILTADLVVDAEIDRVAERLRGEARLGLLVNNAGFGSHGLFFETDVDVHDRMHRLHVLATMRLSHAALGNMTARGSGGLINVASVAGFGQAPGNVSYCATKAWMISFTQGLAVELMVKGSAVKAQALCPGFTLSEFHDVLGMDRGAIPGSLWMPADFVVEESLRGLDKGQVVCVPGWRYKLIARGMKVVPASMAAAMTRRFRKPKAAANTSR
ncbi:MAG: SDR family oxidoreductase [Acidobacteriia bacterium]|nr:SDR family oxidoreductase [Terriglobia bacterium]